MPLETSPRAAIYRVYGMSQSYFTRKLTGYLDYKSIPYRLRRFAVANRAAREAGWPGAMPVVKTPGGEYMWDTTAMIHHFESRFPEPRVFPADPVLRLHRLRPRRRARRMVLPSRRRLAMVLRGKPSRRRMGAGA